MKTILQEKRARRHPRFFAKPLTLTISLLFLGTASALAHVELGITELGTFAAGDDGFSIAYGVNAAGDVVVGQANNGTDYRAFRWTPTDGMTDLGTLAPGDSGFSFAYGVNGSGDVVVGYAHTGSTSHAFRWKLNEGSTTHGTMTDLGTLAAGNVGSSTARAVNAAGDVVVGKADTGTYGHAFRWTLNDGSETQGTMTDLGTLATGNAGDSTAYGVNAAGSVVVGDAATNSGATHAFRWELNPGSTMAGTMTDLGTLKAGDDGSSVAYGVNAAGTVVVGEATTNNWSTHAFRWTATDGMTDLGTLRTGDARNSTAFGVNAAGDVIVGQSATNGPGDRAFRWTATGGMQSIEDWLTANGVTVNASAPKTSAAYGVNAAGDVVVGVLNNNHAFIATGKGMVDQVDNSKSLAGSSGTPARALQDASLVMHGAHSSPMRGLLTAGKQGFWTAGDWGHSDGNEGHLGAGEVGFAHGISDQATVKLALGRTCSKHDTVFGGNTEVDGTYVMPEIIAKVSDTSLYATVSAYYNQGEADITRGYDNAGMREYGHGSTDTRTTAVRARLDWLNAITYGNTAFTPYASATHTRTKIDAYRETGGAFPANWNRRSERSTEARLGLDAVHQLDDKLNLLGRLEGVHRFNDTGASASGDVAGLYGFSLPGQHYKRDWLRAAVGIEGKIGSGIGSLMLNGSTQDDSSKYWIAASYRMDF